MATRLIFAFILSLAVLIRFTRAQEREGDLRDGKLKKRQITTIVHPLTLPYFVPSALLTAIIFDAISFKTIALQFFEVFAYSGLYYIILAAIMPFLRKILSARACSMMWLVPGLTYFISYLTPLKGVGLYTVVIPSDVLPLIIAIWLTGFVFLMGWQMASHLSTRGKILGGAKPISKPEYLALWGELSEQYGIIQPVPLVSSPNVETPMTIGVNRKRMVTVLPAKGYTERELKLIFKHELRHIVQEDSATKFLLAFLRAMSWFNPLVWFACNKAAEDIELSCDEAVLHDADDDERTFYASLLLQNAGESRGFTTNLSSSATSLRYRLKMVVQPKKRFTGGLFVALAFFVLMSSIGLVTFADEPRKAEEVLYIPALDDIYIEGVFITDPETLNESYQRPYGGSEMLDVYGYDIEALFGYLASLSIQKPYNNTISNTIPDMSLSIHYYEMDGNEILTYRWLSLSEGEIEAATWDVASESDTRTSYIVTDDIAWDYIYSLLDLTVPEPEISYSPKPPYMLYLFDYASEGMNDPSHGYSQNTGSVLSIYDNKTNRSLKVPFWMRPGYYGNSTSGTSGAPVMSFEIAFPTPPIDGYTVLVEAKGSPQSYAMSSEDYPDGVFPAARYFAKYTVTATFETSRDMVYEMVYTFQIKHG